ncbi:MAG: SPOR domain-containing protein [Gammaproteobacteria bacterium]
MAKDYARRAASQHRRGKRAKTKSVTHAWVWLLTGLMLGLMLAGLLSLKHEWVAQKWAELNTKHANANRDEQINKHTTAKTHAHTPKPTFDFYTILANQQTDIASEESSQQTDKATGHNLDADKAVTNTTKQADKSDSVSAQQDAAESTKHNDSSNKAFVVQLASFREFKDADNLKARLALYGYVAQIKEVEAGGKHWYRVRLGPYRNYEIAQDIQRELRKKHQLDSVIYNA